MTLSFQAKHNIKKMAVFLLTAVRTSNPTKHNIVTIYDTTFLTFEMLLISEHLSLFVSLRGLLPTRGLYFAHPVREKTLPVKTIHHHSIFYHHSPQLVKLLHPKVCGDGVLLK
jgi:hypothetical protein